MMRILTRISPSCVVALLIILGIVGVLFVLLQGKGGEEPLPSVEDVEDSVVPEKPYTASVLGASVEGRPIEAFTFGSGSTRFLFVGGVHGGYEWNTTYLAYRAIDYFAENPSVIPKNVTLTIIPVLNPDGLFRVTGKSGRFLVDDVALDTVTLEQGRFNARDVDLNRNFECKWQPTSSWKGKEVSAGARAFSEPEALVLKSWVERHAPSATLFWHSQGGAVYASECTQGILPTTRTLMNAYAAASGYTPIATFDAYPITGDAEGWLASIGIPAITVELATHETIEWEKNLAGMRALFSQWAATGE